MLRRSVFIKLKKVNKSFLFQLLISQGKVVYDRVVLWSGNVRIGNESGSKICLMSCRNRKIVTCRSVCHCSLVYRLRVLEIR